MTLTIFIALCLLGCGFMLYVLLHWVRDTQPENATGGCKGQQDRKQLHIVSSSKTDRNKVIAPTATDSQLVDMGQRTSRFNSSLDYSEPIAYERIARSLAPRKRGAVASNGFNRLAQRSQAVKEM
jgi:hypothetical protein